MTLQEALQRKLTYLHISNLKENFIRLDI